MSKVVTFFIISIIKFYKFLISPILGSRCRYFPSCSDYFLEALKEYGLINGLSLGIKRIVSCHPVKILGGGSGIDFLPNKKKTTKGNLNG